MPPCKLWRGCWSGLFSDSNDMNKKKWILLAAALCMMAIAAGLLTKLRANQRLGTPAIRTSAIPGSIRLKVDLPARVLDYTGQFREPDQLTTNTLPSDTSFGDCLYVATNQPPIQMAVVLMGSDRTSIHKTEFCLEGQGWRIDREASQETTIRIDRPHPYDLPVMKWIATHEGRTEHPGPLRGVYVAWFVAADDEITQRPWQRMWWMARDLLQSGVLQRWALVSYFTVCEPGQEDATYEHLKKFIAASVPEFQLVPRADGTTVAARP